MNPALASHHKAMYPLPTFEERSGANKLSSLSSHDFFSTKITKWEARQLTMLLCHMYAFLNLRVCKSLEWNTLRVDLRNTHTLNLWKRQCSLHQPRVKVDLVFIQSHPWKDKDISKKSAVSLCHFHNFAFLVGQSYSHISFHDNYSSIHTCTLFPTRKLLPDKHIILLMKQDDRMILCVNLQTRHVWKLILV